jgi:RNA polymerase II subunit A small phosphatase-like protein
LNDLANQRPLLILDLDETLLHSSEATLDRPCDFRLGQFFAYRRPYVNDFLERVSAYYDLAVWTSASQAYAELAVTALFSHVPPVKFVWSAARCVRRYDHELMSHYHVKDLRKVKKLGYALERILVIDDSPEKLERNYGNHVQVRPFTGDQADNELPRLASYLLIIHACGNFRKLEKRCWRNTL